MSVNSYADHYFIFGNVDSRDYGIIVSNDNGFESPERDVEEIEIPGRNGTLLIDNGRFKNQTLTYNCILRSDFSDQMDAFRAALCAQFGYQRIEDSFHPDVYRMGRIKGEITPKAGSQYQNGYFDVNFDVKPQKFLLTGETAVTVASGGVITNPTAYPAKPLLEVKGYGEIDINGAAVKISNSVLGYVELASGADLIEGFSVDGALFKNGDVITMSRAVFQVYIDTSTHEVTAVIHSNDSWGLYFNGWWYVESGSRKGVLVEYVFDSARAGNFTAGTSKTSTLTSDLTISYDGGSLTGTFRAVVSYAAASQTFSATEEAVGLTVYKSSMNCGTLSVDSSVSALGDPTYIDLDIGEAWMIKEGSAITLNNAVSLPAHLPELEPDANEIAFDNTITELDIVPRWWLV